MFKIFAAMLITMFSFSSLAHADYGDYPDQPDTSRLFQCEKVAELASDRDTDLLFCKVGRNVSCFATSEGQLDCGFSSNFSYRASDYGRWGSRCTQVANLQREGGGYPLSANRIEVCRVGQGRRAISCFVSSLGGLDCR